MTRPKRTEEEQRAEDLEVILDDGDVPSEDVAIERLLELVQQPAEEPVAAPLEIPARIAGVVIGRVASVDGGVRVAWAGAPEGVAARALVPIRGEDVGRDAAIVFEQQDPARPVVTGLVEPYALPESAGVEVVEGKRRVVVGAPDELVLRCGKASITLTRAGKIIIRGAYVSSIASGTNRVRGGAVEIN